MSSAADGVAATETHIDGYTKEDSRSDGDPAPKASVATSRRVPTWTALSATACTLVVAMIASPVAAEPGDSVPDSGARPAPVGAIKLPGQGGSIDSIDNANSGSSTGNVLGPLATQIMAESRAVEALGERLKRAELDLNTATTSANRAEQAWRTADEERQRVRESAHSAASDAYKHATGLGPFESYADELHKLSRVAPALGEHPGGVGPAEDLLRAESACRAAYQAYEQLSSDANSAKSRRDTIKVDFDQRLAALNNLKSRNAHALRLAEEARDRYEQSLGGGNLGEINADGMAANPRAIDAMGFALAQQRKPYVWGAEGPNSYDCSGLMRASYRSVGYTLPRVANDQYRGTNAIKITKWIKGDLLLPGDLLFFSTDSTDWTKIHHVGMYIGGGRMVHAPTSDDVVRIAPVWWSEFYGATRVFKEVPAAAPRPTTPTAPSTQPRPSQTTAPPTTVPPSSVPPSSPSDPPVTTPPATESTSPSTKPDASASPSDTESGTAAPN